METATALTEIEEPASSPLSGDDTPDGQQPNILHEETIYLAGLTYKDREFVFNHEMPVRVTWDGELWDYESEDYNIRAFEEDKQEAFFSFQLVFDACWENIACEEDEKLTKGAQRMKAALKSLVANTRQIG